MADNRIWTIGNFTFEEIKREQKLLVRHYDDKVVHIAKEHGQWTVKTRGYNVPVTESKFDTANAAAKWLVKNQDALEEALAYDDELCAWEDHEPDYHMMARRAARARSGCDWY